MHELAQQGKECYRSRCFKESSTSQTAYDELQCQLVALKEECQVKIDRLENEVIELRGEMQTLKVEYDEMQIKIEIETQVHSQLYTDNVRQCCLELLRPNHQIRLKECSRNCLLEEYRALILPEVITLWHGRTTEYVFS